MRLLIAAIILFLTIALARGANEVEPNIVYIVADDQSWSDFGFMGNSRVHTPNIDKLASKSARFTNGYLPCSVCRPSLVTLLTGLFPHQHGVFFNHGPPGNSGYNQMTSPEEYRRVRSREFELIQKIKTLPGVLADELGYRSLQTGKFWEGHWRNGGFTAGMTTFTAPPLSQKFGGTRILASGERVAHGNGDAGLAIGRLTMEPIETFITESERDGTPWMVWYAPYLPHEPHDSPRSYFETAARYPDVAPHELPYFASIAQFDDTVGDLIEFVEHNSEPDNTLFVFVSDNGWHPSETPHRKYRKNYIHTRESKRAPFDQGVRSPILFRWDGVIEPGTRTTLASSIDIVPTILGSIGLALPDSPGIDLLNHPPSSDRAVFGEIYPGDASSLDNPVDDLAYRWVRQGHYKLIVPTSVDAWGDYLDETALFDVVSDPHERENLIGQPSLEEIRKKLLSLLDEWYPVP